MHCRSKAPLGRFLANVAAPAWRPARFWWEVYRQKGGTSLQYAPSILLIPYPSLPLSIAPLSLFVPGAPSAPSPPARLLQSSPSLPPRPLRSAFMTGGSGSPGPDPVSADGLPLIICTDCGLRRVVRRKSQQPWSAGQIFYCCPLHKVRIQSIWCFSG